MFLRGVTKTVDSKISLFYKVIFCSFIILPQKMLDSKTILCYHMGVPNFRVFYYQGYLGDKQNIQDKEFDGAHTVDYAQKYI